MRSFISAIATERSIYGIHDEYQPLISNQCEGSEKIGFRNKVVLERIDENLCNRLRNSGPESKEIRFAHGSVTSNHAHGKSHCGQWVQCKNGGFSTNPRIEKTVSVPRPFGGFERLIVAVCCTLKSMSPSLAPIVFYHWLFPLRRIQSITFIWLVAVEFQR